jgi:hypothetical protein
MGSLTGLALLTYETKVDFSNLQFALRGDELSGVFPRDLLFCDLDLLDLLPKANYPSSLDLIPFALYVSLYLSRAVTNP